MRIVYHWLNGAKASSLAEDFQENYERLRALHGDPCCAQVMWDARRGR